MIKLGGQCVGNCIHSKGMMESLGMERIPSAKLKIYVIHCIRIRFNPPSSLNNLIVGASQLAKQFCLTRVIGFVEIQTEQMLAQGCRAVTDF